MPYASDNTHQNQERSLQRGTHKFVGLCGSQSMSMASPVADAFAGAASLFWKETCIRCNAVDLLQGTGLEQMGKELEVWCYRLDNVFPASMHNLLVRQMRCVFDPVGVSESGKSMPSMPRNSLVVSACKHPCVCDPYGGGIRSPTVFQWGNAAADLGQDAARPRLPPAADELLVGTAARYLVQVVAGLPRSVSDLEQQRRYEDMSRFYVVASECDENKSIDPCTDSNPLFSQRGQPQVVLRCNIAGNGILWIGPTQCQRGFNMEGTENKGTDLCTVTGKLTTHLQHKCVVPIWAPENSVIVMGGTFQENMLHWTHTRAELLQACAGQAGNPDTNLQEFAQGLVLHMYAKSAEKQVPVRQTLTFRYIINHDPMCILAWPQGHPPPPPPGLPPPPATVSGGLAVAGGSAGRSALAGKRSISEAFPEDVETKCVTLPQRSSAAREGMAAASPTAAAAVDTAAHDNESWRGESAGSASLRAAAAAEAAVERFNIIVIEHSFADWWAPLLLGAVVNLAGASLPNVNALLDLCASMLLNPRFLEYPLKWTQAVNGRLRHLQSLCQNVDARIDLKDKVAADSFEQMLQTAAVHTRRVMAMRTRFEFLAAISNLLRKRPSVFSHGGELYHPHETLSSGYANGRMRRFVMSYGNFLSWMGQIERDLGQDAQDDRLTISHSALEAKAWQLRLGGGQTPPTFVHAADMRLMKKGPPIRWRLCMLELNSDILDSSKKVTIQCLNNSNDQESQAMWRALIEDLLTMMHHRALLLANRPISSNRARAAETLLPAEVQDARGAPPVVVWLAPAPGTATRLDPQQAVHVWQ